MFQVPEQNVPRSAARKWRAFYGAFAVSTFAHLAGILVCAWLLIGGREPWPATDILTLCSPDEPIEFERDPFDLKQRELSLEAAPGSSPATSVAIASHAVKFRRVSAPVQTVPVTRDVFDSGELTSGLARKVDVRNLAGSGGSQGAGTGSGKGNGGGDNAGKGFFGLKSDAKSVVFVLDCSSSMNSPHRGQWRTRFGRLKYEMLKTVSAMSPETRFYIIFFSKKTIRMPAQGMVGATPDAKRKYLTWMARQKAIGGTDPRTALGYALRLKPDMVYFLTDGSFAPDVRRSLLSIQQYHIAIHTFVFGNPAGAKVMKQIAVQNRGKYTYIP